MMIFSSVILLLLNPRVVVLPGDEITVPEGILQRAFAGGADSQFHYGTVGFQS